MSTKAQLETKLADAMKEISKLTAENDLSQRQIKNLKKGKTTATATIVDSSVIVSLKQELSIAKGAVSGITEINNSYVKKINNLEEIISVKKKKIQSFIELSFFQRMFLTRDDLKTLL